jgi:hypothetical protein
LFRGVFRIAQTQGRGESLEVLEHENHVRGLVKESRLSAEGFLHDIVEIAEPKHHVQTGFEARISQIGSEGLYGDIPEHRDPHLGQLADIGGLEYALDVGE